MGSIEFRKDLNGSYRPETGPNEVDDTPNLANVSGPKSHQKLPTLIDIQAVSSKPATPKGFFKSVLASDWSREEISSSTLGVAIVTGVLFLINKFFEIKPENVQPAAGIVAGMYLSNLLFSNNEIAERFGQITKSKTVKAGLIVSTLLMSTIIDGFLPRGFATFCLFGFALNPLLKSLFPKPRR